MRKYTWHNTILNYRYLSKSIKPYEMAEAEEIDNQKIDNYYHLLQKKIKKNVPKAPKSPKAPTETKSKWGDSTIYME